MSVAKEISFTSMEISTLQTALNLYEARVLKNQKLRPSERAMELALIQEVKDKL